MVSKTLWTKEETMKLIALYVTSPKVWGTWQVLYKAREKRNMCWQAMAEALNTIASKVHCKIHNLRNQVSQELQKMKKKKSGTGVEDTHHHMAGIYYIVCHQRN